MTDDTQRLPEGGRGDTARASVSAIKRGSISKKMLWKDIRLTFTKSRGRFLSIVALLALGAFALVGFKVTGPDMRATAEHYLGGYNLTDLTIIADMGIDDDDAAQIAKASGASTLEFGYLKDCTVSGTHDAVRIFSKPEHLSEFELVEGELPSTNAEIAIGSAMAEEYPLGSTISFDEKEATDGSTSMTRHSFTVVGYVNSTELLSGTNLGNTQSGTGSLTGYAVVCPGVFDVDYYMVARLAYEDCAELDPYGQDYLDRIAAHKAEMEELLADQPEHRLAAVQAEYTDAINEGQQKIDDARAELEDARATLADAAEQIADAHQQINDSEAELADAAEQLAEGRSQLNDAWDTLASGKETLDESRRTIASSEAQLKSARTQLADGYAELASKKAEYEAGVSELASKRAQAEQEAADARAQIDAAQAQIDSARSALEGGKQQYEGAIATLKGQLEQAQAGLAQVNEGITQAETGIEQLNAGLEQLEQAHAAGQVPDEEYENRKAELEAQLAEAQATLAALEAKKLELEGEDGQGGAIAQLTAGIAQAEAAYEAFLNVDADPSAEGEDGGYNACIAALDESQKQVDAKQAELNERLAEGQAQLDSAQSTLEAASSAIAEAEGTLAARQAEYDAGYSAYTAGVAAYNEGLATYYAGLESWQESAGTLAEKTGEYEDGAAKIADAKAELAEKEEEYADGLAEYEDALPDAEQEIANGEADLADARATLAKLSKPAYNVYNRRETPGSEGYRTYDSVSEIVDSLANIFPYFLYFVAALVVSTTMTRMVDEERIGAGTLKALGYDDVDVMKKFLVYGAVAAVAGTILGTALGHTLLPYIVYNAYQHGFTLPPIELHFHLDVSLACLALALVVTLVPAWAVARRELSEKPAALLLPKAPAAGSKVLLERVTPLWSGLSFMRKVTARNLFRYKKRAAMTIFGVAGSVCMLFAGFAVQNSIAGLSEKQFGDIIGYDLIVATNEHVDAGEQAEIDELLASDEVSAHEDVTYVSLTKQAGAKNDAQDITLLVPTDVSGFTDYLNLRNRETGEALELGAEGCVISERIATLTGTSVGDAFTFKDEDNVERSVTVTGICEMYMNHFMFMSPEAYEQVFGEAPESNAFVATLADNSISNTEDVASSFMALSGVKGVVQSTQLINMVDVIVTSLNKIMLVLIVVASLLAIVILYNLVTINVSERIRELSTIKVLGFYNSETTMYIYRETIMLAAIGVPVGWILGRLLQLYIISAVPPETVMFDPSCGWLCFAVSAAVVAVVVFLLYFSVRRRLRNVDMLEALKSVD